MYGGIGGAGKYSEIKFAETISSFNQFGEVDISYKSEIHSMLVANYKNSKHRASIA